NCCLPDSFKKLDADAQQQICDIYHAELQNRRIQHLRGSVQFHSSEDRVVSSPRSEASPRSIVSESDPECLHSLSSQLELPPAKRPRESNRNDDDKNEEAKKKKKKKKNSTKKRSNRRASTSHQS